MSAAPVSSSVKRERLRKLEKIKHGKELRNKLPVYTKDQIRKYRLPYHQAILEELHDKEFYNSAEFIRQLLVYQEDHRRQHIYDVIIQARPLLIESTEELDRIYNGLKQAETAHLANNTAAEIDELLTLAIHYAFGESDWWWLADQLFSQCTKISSIYVEDDGFREAECSYIYGKYLIEQEINIHTGLENLNIGMELSEGTPWSAGRILKRMEKTIFVECCALIYTTMAKQVEETLLTMPTVALEMFMRAKKIGIDACMPRADILFLQGRCEMEVAKPEAAVSSFRRAYLLYKNDELIEKSCEARICLALAYLEMGKWEHTNEELQKLLAFAQKNQLPNYIGMAHLYTGQYYLNQGTPENATPSLVTALNIFHELNDIANREFVENLACVSKGQELFSKYSELILRCETNDVEKKGRNLSRLIQWKDIRTPFAEEMSESIKSLGEEETVAEESLPSDYYKYLNEMEEADEEGDVQDHARTVSGLN